MCTPSAGTRAPAAQDRCQQARKRTTCFPLRTPASHRMILCAAAPSHSPALLCCCLTQSNPLYPLRGKWSRLRALVLKFIAEPIFSDQVRTQNTGMPMTRLREELSTGYLHCMTACRSSKGLLPRWNVFLARKKKIANSTPAPPCLLTFSH